MRKIVSALYFAAAPLSAGTWDAYAGTHFNYAHIHFDTPSALQGYTGGAAAVTILKAFFNEDFIIPNPVEPNLANNALVPYAGPPLTVGGELNKLAANIGIGRDSGGVHYRSDAEQGFLLGEQVAIDILNNEAFLNNEDFAGFSLTKFDGTRITVGGKKKL